jgi:hypothetical protein
MIPAFLPSSLANIPAKNQAITAWRKEDAPTFKAQISNRGSLLRHHSLQINPDLRDYVKAQHNSALSLPLLHNSLNLNRFKEKIMQQIKSVTASFVRHIWRTAL